MTAESAESGKEHGTFQELSLSSSVFIVVRSRSHGGLGTGSTLSRLTIPCCHGYRTSERSPGRKQSVGKFPPTPAAIWEADVLQGIPTGTPGKCERESGPDSLSVVDSDVWFWVEEACYLWACRYSNTCMERVPCSYLCTCSCVCSCVVMT